MDDLKWTELRHRMLREVSTDRDFEFITRGDPTHGRFDHRGGVLEQAEKRGLGDLLRAGLLSTEPSDMDLGDDVDLTDDGRAVLAEWDTAHPAQETSRG